MPEKQPDSNPAVLYGRNDPELLRQNPEPAGRSVFLWAARQWLHRYHGFKVDTSPKLPRLGPYFAITTHFSLEDVLALLAGDPYYPPTGLVIKQSVTKIPGLSSVLRLYGAIPVKRDGHDVKAVRQIRQVFRAGQGICIAAEGTRSRTGNLGPMDETLVSLVIQSARQGIPIIPVAVNGSFESMPTGKVFPRRYPLHMIVEAPLDMSLYLADKVTDEMKIGVATLMQSSLAAMLVPDRRPLPDTPVMHRSSEVIRERQAGIRTT